MAITNTRRALTFGIIGVAIAVTVIIVVLFVMPLVGVYGQVTPTIDPGMLLHGSVVSDLENATLVNATLYENGTAVLLFEPQTTKYFQDGTKLVIEVRTMHPYTEAAGHVFEDGKIYNKVGNEFLIIKRGEGVPGVQIIGER